jgi:hypothetical protein
MVARRDPGVGGLCGSRARGGSGQNERRGDGELSPGFHRSECSAHKILEYALRAALRNHQAERVLGLSLQTFKCEASDGFLVCRNFNGIDFVSGFVEAGVDARTFKKLKGTAPDSMDLSVRSDALSMIRTATF